MTKMILNQIEMLDNHIKQICRQDKLSNDDVMQLNKLVSIVSTLIHMLYLTTKSD